jgi:hypothetical protein
MASPVTTADFSDTGSTPAIALLTRAIGSSLRGKPEAGLAVALQGCDWYPVIDLAMKNRIVHAFSHALGLHGVAAPAAFQAGLDLYRADAFRMNARNLMTTAMATSALQAAGIDAIVFKGPAQQQRLYSNHYVKPSGDVDLLVSSLQYDKAFALFQDTHALDPDCASPWWRVFLGEQTLRSRDGQFTTIDLHYRLQQPGCPSPKDMGGFLSRREMATVGASRAPVPSAQDACLIICLNVVKGLIHREPSGAHVIDLIAGLRMLSDQEIAQFSKLAGQEGLSALSLQIAHATFGFHVTRLGAVPKALPVTDAELTAMTLAPEAETTVWTKRRTMLWVLCDRRALVFVKEAAWAFAGELCRRYTQPGLPTPAVTVAQ